ncbi:MAG: malto-oligosyltrehalose trehalohydrolase [Deltaproteobacteria bacterium]|nr:malto-oligosyltrehalose trehalohydrolase [Deltaproteobacteria bacterium]
MLAVKPVGALYQGNATCRFVVWAPFAEKVRVLVEPDGARAIDLSPTGRGYHEAEVEGVPPGTRYFYELDGKKKRPDPASRSQPGGVHGPSEVVDPSFAWDDAGWCNPPLANHVFYELHTGTFTRRGTFDAAAVRLPYLAELGITALQVMPVASFPGDRNWGYDGVYPFAVHRAYGGVNAFKRLVQSCHRAGLALFLDVVYNHLGPEGNYLRDFGPYFTDRYRTPWGEAVNFDGPGSDEVRNYFIANALYFALECRVDGLRLDALHEVYDFSATPFLKELADTLHAAAQRQNRRVHLVAESDKNDAALVRETALCGIGLDGVWNDDFHHALRVTLTGDKAGYYQDFSGVDDLARCYENGFCAMNRYSPYRGRRHGSNSRDIPAGRFVVYAQNHDQVGNRMQGDRLGATAGFSGEKLALAAVALSPFVPLFFMGQEYGETAPFPYFVSHTAPDLVEAVRKGRKKEFGAFQQEGEPPDPQSEQTFASARLDPGLLARPRHMAMLDFFRSLVSLRRSVDALALPDKDALFVFARKKENTLTLVRDGARHQAAVLFNFGHGQTTILAPLSPGTWENRLDSEDPRFAGAGPQAPHTLETKGEPLHVPLAPRSVLCLVRVKET